MLVVSCSTGVEITDPAQPSPTVGTTSGAPAPTELPIAATQTAIAREVPYTIERVVIATAVNDDGSPRNEVSVLSQEQQNVFLTVQVRDIPDDSRFQAFWHENEEVIGQSEVELPNPRSGSQWVALPFRSIAELNPSATHSVELVINDRSVNTFAFRVGVGDASDIIAEAAFAAGVDDQGELIDPRDEFDRFADQITLVVRISNRVDPTGMIFTADWMRGTVPLAQNTPDGGQPALGEDPNDPRSRTMTFTLVPQSNLVPGPHSVVLRLNGLEIAEYHFVVLTDDDADDQPEPTPTPDVTPTPVEPEVAVSSIVIATDVNDNTSEPEEPVSSLEGYPAESFRVFVAAQFQNLEADDSVEVTVGIGNSIIQRYQMPSEEMDSGWLATEVEFRAPDIQGRTVTYEVIIFVDGARIAATTFETTASGEPPAPTPTPDPFDLRNEDDEDEDD